MQHQELREIIEKNENIEIVGYDRDINSFYQRCSVFCVPSIDDGFGMVVCEAMANGLAVIATTATGASELLTDGVDGFVIPPGEIEILEEKLVYFCDNPEERSKMGQAAYKKYVSYETSNSNYKRKLNELLETLI